MRHLESLSYRGRRERKCRSREGKEEDGREYLGGEAVDATESVPRETQLSADLCGASEQNVDLRGRGEGEGGGEDAMNPMLRHCRAVIRPVLTQIASSVEQREVMRYVHSQDGARGRWPGRLVRVCGHRRPGASSLRTDWLLIVKAPAAACYMHWHV